MPSPLDELTKSLGLPSGFLDALYPFSLYQTTPPIQDRTPTSPMPPNAQGMGGGGGMPGQGMPGQMDQGMGMPGGGMGQQDPMMGMMGGMDMGMGMGQQPQQPGQVPTTGGLNPAILQILMSLIGRGGQSLPSIAPQPQGVPNPFGQMLPPPVSATAMQPPQMPPGMMGGGGMGMPNPMGMGGGGGGGGGQQKGQLPPELLMALMSMGGGGR